MHAYMQLVVHAVLVIIIVVTMNGIPIVPAYLRMIIPVTIAGCVTATLDGPPPRPSPRHAPPTLVGLHAVFPFPGYRLYRSN